MLKALAFLIFVASVVRFGEWLVAKMIAAETWQDAR